MKIDCLCIIYEISKNWIINIVEIWMKITFKFMKIIWEGKHMREKELTVHHAEKKRIVSSHLDFSTFWGLSEFKKLDTPW